MMDLPLTVGGYRPAIGVRAWCSGCTSLRTALYWRARCGFCGTRLQRPTSVQMRGHRIRAHTLVERRPTYTREGARLAEFLERRGWSFEELAHRVRRAVAATARRRGARARSRISGGDLRHLARGEREAGWDVAHAIAAIMRRGGAEPAVFYPGAGEPGRTVPPPMRGDFRKWLRRSGRDPQSGFPLVA